MAIWTTTAPRALDRSIPSSAMFTTPLFSLQIAAERRARVRDGHAHRLRDERERHARRHGVAPTTGPGADCARTCPRMRRVAQGDGEDHDPDEHLHHLPRNVRVDGEPPLLEGAEEERGEHEAERRSTRPSSATAMPPNPAPAPSPDLEVSLVPEDRRRRSRARRRPRQHQRERKTPRDTGCARPRRRPGSSRPGRSRDRRGPRRAHQADARTRARGRGGARSSPRCRGAPGRARRARGMRARRGHVRRAHATADREPSREQRRRSRRPRCGSS